MSTLPRITQLVSGKAGSQTRQAGVPACARNRYTELLGHLFLNAWRMLLHTHLCCRLEFLQVLAVGDGARETSVTML